MLGIENGKADHGDDGDTGEQSPEAVEGEMPLQTGLPRRSLVISPRPFDDEAPTIYYIVRCGTVARALGICTNVYLSPFH